MAGIENREALRNASETVLKYLKDIATLSVETRTAETGVEGAPLLAARTVVSLDGDNSSVVPMRRDDDGKLVVDSALYEVHMQNVGAAIDYRAKVIDAALSVLRNRA